VSAPEKIGAFFDLDGTVVAPPSLEWRFVAYLLARDQLRTRDIARWLAYFAKRIAFDPRAAVWGNKHYLASLRESLAAEWEQSLAENPLRIYPAAIDRMVWHRRHHHRVLLVSGTLGFLASAVAPRLPGPVEVRATELETCGGCWTGGLIGEHMSGEAKAAAVRELAARLGLSLWESYAYADSVSDLPMLDAVGHRMAVNSEPRLRRIARNEGWPVCDWTEPRSASTPATQPLATKAAR